MLSPSRTAVLEFIFSSFQHGKEVQFKRKFEMGEGAVGGWKCTEAAAARIVGRQYELLV
jgi:hypothetical protein